LALAGWLEAGSPGLDNGVALGNRLVDGLGADQTLAGPLRDLARRPQLRQALASSGTARRAALSALVVDLRSTYAPAVLAELVELLEVGLGVGGLALSETAVGNGNGSGALDGTRSAAGPASVAAGRVVVSAQLAQGQGPEGGQGLKAGAVVPPEAVGSPPLLSPADPQGAPFARRQPPLDWRNLRRDLLPLGPGLALGAAMALVLAWLAGVLDEELLAPRQWSAGLALVLALACLQIATLAGPLSILRRSALLLQGESGQPRFAWRWVSAPWLHRRHGEALVNVLLLLLILGPTPLGWIRWCCATPSPPSPAWPSPP